MGYVVGPGSSLRERCEKTMRKYTRRRKEFSRAKLAPSAGLRYHESFAAATLSYVAQATPDDDAIHETRALATQRLLHLPWRAVPSGAAPMLSQAGLLAVRDLGAACAAARMRAADRVADDVRECAERLEAARAVTRSLRWRTLRRSATMRCGTAPRSRTRWGPIFLARLKPGGFINRLRRVWPPTA